MSQIITIKNEYLTVEVSTLGAELQSVNSNKNSFLWDGHKPYWSGRAPILFPICSSLVDNTFTHKGKSYTLSQHGFAKTSEFIVECCSEDSVTLLLKSNRETIKAYPFDFEFRVSFSLEGKTLVCKNEVLNKSNETMFYSDGSHEAYNCPKTLSGYSVEFEKEETLRTHPFNGRLVDETELIATSTKLLPLKDDYFEVDALIFTDLKSKKIALVENEGTRRITLEFPEHPYLLIWSMPGSPFVCFEPWRGLPDTIRCTGELSKKEGIMALEPDIPVSDTHKITFED